MQQVAVEKDDAARLHLDGNRVVVAVGKFVRRICTIKARVFPLVHGPEDAGLVRAGDHPQAAVFDGCIIERDPAARQRAIARGDKVFVLVPILPRLARRLDKEHGLHTLHVRPDNLRQRLHHFGVGEVALHQRRNFVGKMNAEVAAQHVGVRLARIGGLDAAHVAQLTAADARGLVAQRLHFVRRERVVDDEVAIFMVKIRKIHE